MAVPYYGRIAIPLTLLDRKLSYLNVATNRVVDIHEELFSLVSALTGNKDVTTFTSILRVIEQNDTYDQIRSVYVYTSDVHY